jgi:hypothetical protein
VGYFWEGNIGIGSVTGNVWSRSARRKIEGSIEDSEEVKLGFRINVIEKQEASQVEIEWIIGIDVVLFESFCGKVKTIVQQNH